MGRPQGSTNKARPQRVKFQTSNKFDVPPRKGYQRYWALDDGKGQIDRLQAAYWDFVMEDGRKKTLPAGGGQVHYLMEIEERYYKEDMEEQQKEIDNTMKQRTKVNEEEFYTTNSSGEAIQRERI